ncbi:MAG: hypothetical protein RLZZ267_701 [Bacillota bacterium]
MNQIDQAVSYIQTKLNVQPEIGLILGSGLGMVADLVKNPIVIPYKEIPNFPVSTVEGHAGELVVGELHGKHVVVMKGRFHLYEGYQVQQVAFPVRVMRKLGVTKMLVTNASGGVNTAYKPGDLMLITDHLNFQFTNPLLGANADEFGVRFPDMSEAYSKRMRQIALEVAAEQNIALQQGVYLGLLGPSYETPAEIRMIRTLGGDAVGMSTVAETITARHAGIEVLGISCISNMAAGILDQPLSHDEVMETTGRVQQTFLNLVLGIIPRI